MPIGSHRLHPQGPEISDLVWGQWRILEGEETDTPEKLARRIALCLELGISSFDNADIYGGYQAETLFGKALKVWGGDRDTITDRRGIAWGSDRRERLEAVIDIQQHRCRGSLHC